MGKGKRLTVEEISKITFLRSQTHVKLSNREITREIGRSETVIRNFLKKGVNYGKKAKTKGNTKLTLRQKGQILDEATKNRLNCRQIKDTLALPTTKQYIARILRQSKKVKWKKMMGKPKLTTMLKQKRLLFAKKICTGLMSGKMSYFRKKTNSIWMVWIVTVATGTICQRLACPDRNEILEVEVLWFGERLPTI